MFSTQEGLGPENEMNLSILFLEQVTGRARFFLALFLAYFQR